MLMQSPKLPTIQLNARHFGHAIFFDTDVPVQVVVQCELELFTFNGNNGVAMLGNLE